MDLRTKIQTATKDAMKAKDTLRLSTLRLISAAIKDREIAARTGAGEGEALSDADLIAIMSKMVKQRQESARSYEEGGRLELAEKENAEIEVIEEFLPRRMSEDETLAAIDAVIAELDANSVRDMGRVMAGLKSRYSGQMDFGAVGQQVKEKLL
ncbi:GatB/YqeY domain-containing protein [Paracoccus aerodenitrificans]|uniref:GatB/YqeY domain-containing protein n=1 Tax=Paracoccus aerodenitrificans TaxID=3017781 RepID=UPI0022F02115|nr:GatB/YqeY domain-containing protein [Paracoccus aerodenitrificans]WBU64423.1 GatB/YqeY domain-containing protein [Paracoccus aerodenitrificans]